MQRENISSGKLRMFLILFFICTYMLPLNFRPLGVPDEMRYGEIAREICASGDWVVPHLNGLRYFEKPMGGHALNAIALQIFGETNFSVRLMSVLFTALSALVIFRLLRPREGEASAAFAVFVFLTMGLVLGIGTYSVLDSMVSGLITLSLGAFFSAWLAEGRKKLGWLVLVGAGAGAAFLVKGFIALAVPVLVIIPFLLFRRDWKSLFTLPWIPLVSALAVALPWCLAIAAREPDFWHYFFWEEHVRRFFSQEHAQHAAPFWYFIPVFLAGVLPWTFMAIRPLRNFIQHRRRDPFIQFAGCWSIAPFLFFSASSGKLATYILPCFAPLAILIAMALLHAFKEEREEPPGALTVKIFFGIVLFLLASLLVVAGLNAFGQLPVFGDGSETKIMFLLLFFLGAFILLLHATATSNGLRKSLLLGGAVSILFIGISTSFPFEVSTEMGIQTFLQKHRNDVDDQTLLVGTPKTTHALCYEYKRNKVYLFRCQSEFAYGLAYPDAQNRFLKDAAALQNLIATRNTHRVVIVIKSEPDDPLRVNLPRPDRQTQWLSIWFAVYEPNPE